MTSGRAGAPESDDPAGWSVEIHQGDAADLHALDVPAPASRQIWVLEPSGPAVVLGSTQRDDVVDREAAAHHGVAVARRRSGGGAVWVDRGDPVWLDVIVPRDDPLWHDDVGRSFAPIGTSWSVALGALGVEGTQVHDGPMMRAEWSDLVCFAGVGPGEVLVGDRKMVGISQRRTRAGARFQCAVFRHWDPEPLRRVLAAPPGPGTLDDVGVGIGAISTGDVVEALRAALATATS